MTKANDIESFCGREPNFQHGIVPPGLCKLGKIAQFEHLLWLLFLLTAFRSQRAPTCLGRPNHACVSQVKPAIDDVPKETAACYLVSVLRILDYRHFRTVEDIFMLALYMLIYICVKGGFEAPDRNGKTFVPRFTLSRDKPYVVVTETCQNTPICECLFTYGFSKQYPTVSEYSNEL